MEAIVKTIKIINLLTKGTITIKITLKKMITLSSKNKKKLKVSLVA
jgi:hypothetical protein